MAHRSFHWSALFLIGLGTMTLTLPRALGQAGQGMPPPEQMSGIGVKPEFTVNDADPESNVPSQAQAMSSPLHFGYYLMDLAAKAEDAEKSGNLAQAAKYYRAMGEAVPDRATAFVKLCKVYEKLGQRADAIATCQAALGRSGVTVADFIRYVERVLASKPNIAAADLDGAQKAIAHLKQQKGAEYAGNQLQCELALREGDEASLSECSRALLERTPEDPKAITFGWALAIQRGQVDEAKAFLVRAQEAKLAPEALRKMQAGIGTLQRAQDSVRSGFRDYGPWLALLLGLLALALLGGKRVSRLKSA